MLTLLILPRKGLYQLTICRQCGHIFGCPNCDANLITYRQVANTLELFCNQCQTFFAYPDQCPQCNSKNLSSKYGGIEELVENLATLGKSVYRFDKIKTPLSISPPKTIFQQWQISYFVTTRLFDPTIAYEQFDRIVFVSAENLLANPDYLTTEEVAKNLAEVLLRVKDTTEIIFDTANANLALIQNLLLANTSLGTPAGIKRWYFDFLQHESNHRQQFGFPPFKNLLLLTTQEKKPEQAETKLQQLVVEFSKYLTHFPEVEISKPYPARFFKRKNFYSYHLLIKYPRQYSRFAQFRELIVSLSQTYNVQVRLNPRHLF